MGGVGSVSSRAKFSSFSLINISGFRVRRVRLLLFVRGRRVLFVVNFLVVFVLLGVLYLCLFDRVLGSVCGRSALQGGRGGVFVLGVIVPCKSTFLLKASLTALFVGGVLPVDVVVKVVALTLVCLVGCLFLSGFLRFSSGLRR